MGSLLGRGVSPVAGIWGLSWLHWQMAGWDSCWGAGLSDRAETVWRCPRGVDRGVDRAQGGTCGVLWEWVCQGRGHRAAGVPARCRPDGSIQCVGEVGAGWDVGSRAVPS